jgi:hypothetical protein
MYIESFILSVAAPAIQGGCIFVGEVHEGTFSVEGFPGEVECGALIEFALDESDTAGTFEVELLVEYSRLDGAPQALVGQAFSIQAVEPSAGWWGPRLLVPQPLALRLRFWDEFEGFLVVRVNGEELAEKAFRVYHNYVPDQLRPGEPS